MKSGNRNVFQLLYESYYDGLYFYGVHLTRDEDMVKDTLQDLFIRIWVNKSKLTIQHSFKFYLFSAFRKNLLKKLKREKPQVDCYALNIASQTSNVEEGLIDEEKRHTLSTYLKNHIDRLSPRQKEIVHLKFFEGLSYKEIGIITGLDQQYLYNIINNVSRILKSRIDKKKLSEL